MSNVLIGIIGVILFIGLALAGALFLGPRFQSSSNNAKAAHVVSVLQQAAHAANMYRVDIGKEVFEGDEDAVGNGYMKSWPDNPYFRKTTDQSLQMRLLSKPEIRYAPNTSTVAKVVTVRLLKENREDEVSVDVCKAIQRSVGASDTLGAADGVAPVGCGYYGVTIYAWARI